MKVIAREGVWASAYFTTAINHCIEADKLLAKISATNDLSEHIKIDARMNEAGAITVVFSAMCIEAYMNDYLAQKIGESTFYKQYEHKRSPEKLNLVLGTEKLDGKSRVESAVKNLFSDRNSLVHAKSHDISYESGIDCNLIQPSEIEHHPVFKTYWRDYCARFANRANQAICAVLLLCEYMQRKEPCFRTDASLIGLNAIPILPMEIIDKIRKLCDNLEISLPIRLEYLPIDEKERS